MQSQTTKRFRKVFEKLPSEVQLRAQITYKLWRKDSNYPGLHFKKVSENSNIYSVRIGLSYRALGIKHDDILIWFWVGSHEDYNNLIRNL